MPENTLAEWDLAATNLGRARGRKYEVAVIPTAAIEPHNRHLPYGQDFLHTTHVARTCCAAAWEKSPNLICLPALPYGVDCNLLDFPLTIHVSQAALDAILRDIITSLRRHGLRKIVILNGHGGNDFTAFIRQIQCDLDVFVFACNWWQVGRDQFSRIFEHPDDHAGEFETSVGLALYPEIVELAQAGSGATPPFRFEALRQAWVRTSRNFSKMNGHCAAGNPAGASAEKGRRYLDLVMTRITQFLVELALAPIDDHFPFTPIQNPSSAGSPPAVGS